MKVLQIGLEADGQAPGAQYAITRPEGYCRV